MGSIVGIALLVSVACLAGCGSGRTQSRERFSELTDIGIPPKAEVLKDEYHDMMQDYALTYEIRLTENEMQELAASIRMSKYYGAKKDAGGCVWTESANGFRFENGGGMDCYSATVDTIALTACFIESRD